MKAHPRAGRGPASLLSYEGHDKGRRSSVTSQRLRVYRASDRGYADFGEHHF